MYHRIFVDLTMYFSLQPLNHSVYSCTSPHPLLSQEFHRLSQSTTHFGCLPVSDQPFYDNTSMGMSGNYPITVEYGLYPSLTGVISPQPTPETRIRAPLYISPFTSADPPITHSPELDVSSLLHPIVVH